MALQNVTLKFSARKSSSQLVAFTQANGTTTTEITSTQPTVSQAKAAIQAVIDGSIAIAQGNVDDQNEASGLFNS